MNLKQNIALIAASLALFSLAVCDAGCTAASDLGVKVGTVTGICAVGAIPGAVQGIAGDVQQALSGGTPDWAVALTAIAEKVGGDVLTCALKSLLGMRGYQVGGLDEAQRAKAQFWMATH